MNAKEAASRLLAWFNKHMAACNLFELDELFEKRWDQAVKQTCDKYKVERADLFSAIIDLL